MDTFLPDPVVPEPVTAAAAGAIDFSSLLAGLNQTVPVDLETAVIAVMFQSDYDEYSGSLSTPGGISASINLDKPGSLSIVWEPPKPSTVSGVNATQRNYREAAKLGCIVLETVVYTGSRVPLLLHGSLLDFIMRANYGMRVGNFVLDSQSGSVVFRSSLHIGTTIGFQDLVPLVRKLLDANIKTHKHYLPGLTAVIENGASPVDAIVMVEGAVAGALAGLAG